MSVAPLSGRLDALLGGLVRQPQDAATRAGRPAPTATGPTTHEIQRPPTASITAAPAPSLPAAPPSGVDPELWSVLTTDERAFFAKVGNLGPLTYGRSAPAAGAPAAPPAVRGGRLDVMG
ncbi:MAG TPA: hypothetical protein VHQ45_00790 [Gemmatimonadaceae bacterium]|jgi:hypothetical protein|nr:hypothetical protein [Gemmatimonadaceae bacterium]